MQNIFRKAKLAVTSRLNYKKELTPTQIKRLQVCKTCPLNSDNKENKTNRDKVFMLLNRLLDKVFGIVTTEDAICLQCGCNLIHKSSQEDKQDWCGLGKWDNIK